ncbi:MAG: cysteine hydrolase [Oscillospiraceae bacterium]|nr:cysteine hydrolase [Oscillospiraceae bacterium]
MVLLVIDAQQMLVNDKMYAYMQFIDTVQTLIRTARRNGVEVIYVRHFDGVINPVTRGADGYDIYSGFAPEEGEKIYDKKVNSPFKETGLLEYLRKKGETTLMVTGLQTDYCIDATVKCGFEHGFEIIIPAFGNTTFDNEFMTAEQSYNYYNRCIWNKRYGRCISAAEAVRMIEEGED